MDKILDWLTSRGLRRGLVGGNQAWLAAGAAAWLLRRMRRSDNDVVFSRKIPPGHSLVIVNGRATVGPSGDPEDDRAD